MGLNWAEIDGTNYGNPELSTEARQIASQMCVMEEAVTPATDFALGRKSGDTVAYRLYGRISTSGTTALGEYQKVPFVDIPEYTGTGVVYRRGVAVGWTGTREDLDRLDVESTVVYNLAEHSGRTHNTLIYNQAVTDRSFAAVLTTSSNLNFTTNGTPSGTAAAPFTGWAARQIKKNFDKYNVPKFDGAGYLGIVSPTMYYNLFDDTAASGFIDVKKYAPGGADGALRGEAGSYMSLRFTIDNHAMTDGIGSGSAYGSGMFFGADAIKEIVVYPMQLLANMNLSGDFGQQKAIAWLSFLGYKGPWNYTSHGQGTICHYTTA